MSNVNAYYRGEYLGSIQTNAAHSLAPGQVVTVRNLICNDTCTAKILQNAEYTDRFFTSRFRSHQWCAVVEVQEPWTPPKPPEHSKHCAKPCLTTTTGGQNQ